MCRRMTPCCPTRPRPVKAVPLARPRGPARCPVCQYLPVRPLALIGVGVSFVVLDFRTDAPDLLPDVAGWALIALAAWRLELTAAARVAAVAGAGGLAEAWLPFRYVQVDPVTGERLPDGGGTDLAYPEQLFYDDVTGWHLAAMRSPPCWPASRYGPCWPASPDWRVQAVGAMRRAGCASSPGS